MWWLYSLLGLAALLLLLLLVPVWVRLTYDGALRVRLWVLGVPVTVYPRERAAVPETDPTRRKAAKKPSKLQELADLLRQDDVEGTLHFLKEAARLAGRATKRVLKAVTVDRLWLQMRIATGEPDTTAQRYGQVCAVLYPTLEWIGHLVRIRRRDLRVEPNFLMESCALRVDIRLRVSVWRLLFAAVAFLCGFIILNEEIKPQDHKEVT